MWGKQFIAEHHHRKCTHYIMTDIEFFSYYRTVHLFHQFLFYLCLTGVTKWQKFPVWFIFRTVKEQSEKKAFMTFEIKLYSNTFS